MGADGRPVAEHGPVDDVLPVDRVRDRLPDAGIVQRLARVVHGQDGLPLGGADDDGELRVGLELGQRLGRGEVREGVDIARHHRGEGGVGVGDELERRGLQRHGLAPVVVVAHDLDPVALHPFGEAERPGAHGVGGVGLGARGVHDHRVAPCHLEGKRPVGCGEGDDDGGIIHGLDAFDPGKKRFLGVGAVLGPRAVEREDHVLGGHRAAVMEGDALAQVEGVGQPVLRDVPAFGQPRDDGPIGREARQPLEDVGVDDLVDGGRGARGRVEIRRLQHHSDGDVGLLRQCGAGAEDQRKRACPQQSRAGCKDASTHCAFLPVSTFSGILACSAEKIP
jgi:hypothetical protein